MSDQQRASAKVSVEDLLRFKRAERPPPEFWVDFERSLRAKQLAALVEKRPWWKSWRGISRWSVPVGAAAALTVTVISFSSRSKQSMAPLAGVKSIPVARNESRGASVPAAVVVVAPAGIPTPAATVAAVEPAPAVSAPVVEHDSLPVQTPEPSVPAGHLASVTEQVAGIAVDADSDSVPTARFATVRASSTMPAFSFDHTALAQSDDSFHSVKPSAVEPLAQMSTPRDARRARLLAFTSSVDTRAPQYSNSTGVIRSRERIASHLNEEALYDSIRRLGVKDGGVSIQF